MAKEAVILLSDLHINSTLGVCKPGIELDDGGSYVPNRNQRWLNDTFETFIQDMKPLINGHYTTLILVGDILELDSKGRSSQVITKNPASALFHAVEFLDPLVGMVDDLFVIRGTEAHTGQSAWGEEMLGKDFDAIPSNTGGNSWWHLRAFFGGVKWDLAHHGSMGSLPYTYANAAMKLAVITRIAYAEYGERPPDIVARAHNHRFADSGRTFDTRALCLPCWQYKTAYIHRIGKENTRPHIGGLVIQCHNGEYDLYDLLYRAKRRPAWKRSQRT